MTIQNDTRILINIAEPANKQLFESLTSPANIHLREGMGSDKNIAEVVSALQPDFAKTVIDAISDNDPQHLAYLLAQLNDLCVRASSSTTGVPYVVGLTEVGIAVSQK